MKKFLLLIASGTLVFPLGTALAEPTAIQCSADISFEENACDVCYTEEQATTGTELSWTSNISTLALPWEHGDGELAEIIYDKELNFPEWKTTFDVTTNPAMPEDLWINSPEIAWKTFPDSKEFFIESGKKVTLWTLADDATVTVKGSGKNPSAILVNKLTVRDFDVATNEQSTPADRTICLQEKFITPTTTVDPINNNTTTPGTVTLADENDNIIELDAAGPNPDMTADQTTPETGPGIWIILALAFVFAGGWSAWQQGKKS